MKYNFDNISTMYNVRDISRGKTSEMINKSIKQPVVIIKNSKPVSVLINYDEYLKLTQINMKKENDVI